jgi:rhodanese-related sulfurtransferase
MKMPQRLKSIDAQAAARLKDEGALMVDVREGGEFARSRIPGSQNIPLSRLEQSELPHGPGQPVVFFCAGGNRTSVHAARLAEKAGRAKAYVLAGGLSAWGQAGLPVESGSAGQSGTQAGPGFLSRLFAR